MGQAIGEVSGVRRLGAREVARRIPAAQRQALGLALLVLLALALRIIRLDFQPLWWDEGYSVWFATHPLGQMAALTALDIHPPLYYALLRGWILVLGAGPIALRLFSVLDGLLAVPAIYLAGRRLLSPRAAVLAALLLAANPLHIYYSQEVRMYGLVALLSTATLAVAWPLFTTARPRIRSFIPYVLLITAGLYTQYYVIFLPVGLTLFACWHWRRDLAALGRWFAAQLVCALLFLPWLVYATPRLIPYVSQKVLADADRPLDLLPYVGRHLSAFLAGHLEGGLAGWWPACLLLLAPLLAGLVLAVRSAAAAARPARGHEGASPAGAVVWWNGRAGGQAGGGASPEAAMPPAIGLLTIVVLTSLALGYAISRRFPFFPPGGERLLLLALPAFTLLNAAAIAALWRRVPAGGLLAVALVCGVAGASLASFYTVPRYAGDDYRPLIARSAQQGLPEDTVFCVYPWQVGYWRSYSDPRGPQAQLTPAPGWGQPVAAALDAALGRGRIWFPEHLALGAILEGQIEAYLGRGAREFANTWYGPGTRLSAWTSAGPDLADVPFSAVDFALPGGGTLRLAAASGQQTPVPAANAVTLLTLRWQAAAAPPALGASVRLVDTLGQVWAQNDYEPLGGAGSSAGAGWQAEDRIGLLIPAGTPSGDYEVQVLVHPAGDGRPLAARQGGASRPTGGAPLYRLTVAPAGRALGSEHLPLAHLQPADLGDGIRFLGYSAAETVAQPGDLRKVSLFWQATARPTADYTAFLQLLPAAGPPAAGWEAPPGAAYATGRWDTGTLMRSQATLRLPAGLPDGRYRLIAGLFRQSDGRRLTAAGRDYVDLGSVTVRGRPHSTVAPNPSLLASRQFGNLAHLAGYDLPATTVTAGGSLSLTLYWQAAGTTDKAYTVFVHLLDAQGNLAGSGDGEPGGGTLPTTGWLAGEYLVDRHTVGLAAEAKPGSYRLAIGLYDPASGQRLTTPDGADQIILATPITLK